MQPISLDSQGWPEVWSADKAYLNLLGKMSMNVPLPPIMVDLVFPVAYMPLAISVGLMRSVLLRGVPDLRANIRLEVLRALWAVSQGPI